MWRAVLKVALALAAVAIAAALVPAILKVLLILGFYRVYSSLAEVALGLDSTLAFGLALLAATVTVLFVLPTLAKCMVLWRSSKAATLLCLAVISVTCLGVWQLSQRVFFNRKTGEGRKFYVKTLTGYEFSETGGYHPVFGVQYKPVTPEVIREYFLWRASGRHPDTASPQPDRLFDRLTGEPLVWYADRGRGVELYPFPGFDPMTGEALRPLTREKAEGWGPELASRLEQAALARRLRESIDQGRFVPELYFADLPGVAACASGGAQEGHSVLFGDYVYDLNVRVEKVISLGDTTTAVGVVYEALDHDVSVEYDGLYLLDRTRVKHVPRKIIGGSFSDDNRVGVLRGERRRIIYVFDDVPIEDVQTGALTGTHYVEFHLQT